MRNFASTLVKFSKLSHIQTTVWRPPKMAPPRTAGSAGPFVTPLIKFMLKFMDLSKIDDNEISLLRKISNASKTAARALITNDFTRLVNIFDQLKSEFDEMLESESGSDSDEEIADPDEETNEDSAEKSDIDSDQESEEDSVEKIDSDKEIEVNSE